MMVAVLGSVWSARALELRWQSLQVEFLAAALILGFMVLPLNAAEYQLSSRLSGIEVSFYSALSVTLLASALNVLPVPAGAAVRVQGLREEGVGTTRALAATGGLSVMWLGLSTVCAAVALAHRGESVWGVTLGVLGLGLAAVASRIVKGPQGRWSDVARAAVVETLFVLVASVRFYLVVRGLGVGISPSQAVVVAGSSALASAIGVVPGVFGLFEGLAAGLAAFVGLPASSGFLATALLRLMAAATVGSALLILAVWPKKSQPGVEPERSAT